MREVCREKQATRKFKCRAHIRNCLQKKVVEQAGCYVCQFYYFYYFYYFYQSFEVKSAERK